MAIDLDLGANKISRGVSIDLAKVAPGVKRFEVGLSWKENAYDGEDFDLDLILCRTDASGKVTAGSDIIYYGIAEKPGQSFSSPEGDVIHSGDERVGAKDGDDETATIDTTKTPAYLQKYIAFLAIFEADKRKQNFGMVEGAMAEVRDADTKQVLATIDLSEQVSSNTIINAFEFIKSADGTFKVKNVSQGFSGGVSAAFAHVGVNVA